MENDMILLKASSPGDEACVAIEIKQHVNDNITCRTAVLTILSRVNVVDMDISR